MNCAKKIKQRNREMHRRGFLYDPSQTYTPARDRQSLPRTIRPASISSVRRAIAFVENLYSCQMFTSENRKLMFLYHYNENKWNHATAETPFGQIVYRAVKSDNGKTMRVTELQSPFGNYSEQSIDPREQQIGQMLSGADNIAEIDRRISALFFRVVDSLDAITPAELSFNNLDAAKPDIDTPSM